MHARQVLNVNYGLELVIIFWKLLVMRYFIKT